MNKYSDIANTTRCSIATHAIIIRPKTNQQVSPRSLVPLSLSLRAILNAKSSTSSPYGAVYHRINKSNQYSTIPLRYPKLALGLSLGILAQIITVPVATAATPISTNNSTSYDELTNPPLEQSKEGASSNAQLEAALIALKLKRAVELGLIDASVLEDYKRETLAQPNAKSTLTDDQIEGVLNGKDISNALESIEVKEVTPELDAIKALDLASQAEEIPSSEHYTSSQSLNDIESSGDDTSFDDAFDNAGSFIDLDNTRGQSKTNDPTLQSPAEIDALLNQVSDSMSTEFDNPIARLDNDSTPVGIDNSVDNIDDINFNVPSSRVTFGNDADEVKSQPIITPEGSTGQVSSTEDITNLVSNTAPKKTDKITAEVLAQASDRGNDGLIDPDDYLPVYDDSNTSMTKAEADAVLASDASADTSVSNDEGFFKRIYNRLFNDGYSSLPRLKADIYIQDESRLDGSLGNAGTPVLIKADEDVQPANNIKAAMENITVEAISDFTAALPKLREEALMAARAVGYYDINLRFNRTNNNSIDVIIEQLGQPVKVSSRLVDIRGEGAKLPEFQVIANEAKPLEGDVFNHGAYKHIKTSIEEAEGQLGFFDGKWLNQSVDVILPDNTADIDLIYDTGGRYHFDEVVFFTVDEDTGKLTTDPDKLPVKPELLHQLYSFDAGDDFYNPKVISFINDLSATKYFNLVNVEVVRPDVGIGSQATIGFDNKLSGTVNNNENDTINNSENGSNDSGLDKSKITANDPNQLNAEESTNVSTGVEMVDNQNNEDIEPIAFSVDEETLNKLEAIKLKAERLITLPNNRVLDAAPANAKNLLGKVSEVISNTVAKILPKEEEDIIVIGERPQNLDAEVLQDRKSPQDVAASKAVPLYVFVMADKPKDVDLGIGYGSDTGIRAVARLQHNLINRDGYQAGINIGASNIKRSIDIHASRPWKHPLNDKLYANLSYEQEEKTLGDNKPDLMINTIKAGVARHIRQETGWNRIYSLNYRLDQVDSDVSGDARKNLPYPFNVESAKFNQQSLLLGYAIDKTITDNVTNPTSGWHQYYSIEAGSDSALTDTNMAIVRAGLSGIYSFGDLKRHQVLGSFDGGYLWSDDFKNVPFQERFYAGGDRSIRGYDYHSLSALDDNNNLIGGEILALGSAEYNYEFKPGFRGAVFADVGNAYDADLDTETKLGVGFGIRWASPVGMVRLDLAAGVLEDSIPIRLHFFIGSPLQ